MFPRGRIQKTLIAVLCSPDQENTALMEAEVGKLKSLLAEIRRGELRIEGLSVK